MNPSYPGMWTGGELPYDLSFHCVLRGPQMLPETLENAGVSNKYVHIICESKDVIYLFFGTARTPTLSDFTISGHEAEMASHLFTAFYSLQMQKSPLNYWKHCWYAKDCKGEKEFRCSEKYSLIVRRFEYENS